MNNGELASNWRRAIDGARLPGVFALALCIVTLAWFSQSMGATPRRYTIAIATLMTQPALDAVQNEMKAELAREEFIEGKNGTFIEKNASGQANLAPVIAKDLVSRNPNVLVAITTPMAEAAHQVTRSSRI